MTPKRAITPDLIRAALAYIPADLARDEWARIAMAIKSEFADDVGLALFTDWSATADGYDAAEARSTWRSIKAGGGVAIGTLLHVAKEYGYVLPPVDAVPGAAGNAPAPAVPDRNTAARNAEEKARQAAAHEAAAMEAEAVWAAAAESATSPYVAHKGVQAVGVRVDAAGWLLVPLRDAAGRLWNVQRIAPAKPVHGPEKLFLKNGRKSGLWHMLGTPAGAAVLMVAEGYATAATLHEATGRPVAVAFDAGNLVHVATALHAAHPAALIVVAGDDDQASEARTGRNTGRLKALAAAKACRGIAVISAGLPEGASDFNDLRQHIGGTAGLDAVRTLVDGAITEHHASASAGMPERDRQHQELPDGDAFDPFTVSPDGVYFAGVDREGRPLSPEWICSRLDVAALTRDQDGAGWSYLLQFADPLGRGKQWAMPARMLAGDGGEYRAMLLNMGLRVAPSPRARNKLTEYIQTRRPPDYASCTDRIGWHGRAFVLPHETFGDEAERIVFQSDTQMENTFRVRGEAAQWRDRVGALCVGNSRLVFSVACAFAGPLLRPAGMESGGFHLRGDSSSGKTTALKLAASVYGGSNYLQRWRTTDNALEAIAAQHCDSLLILDELAQVDPKTAGECAYMLANEQSKARATRNGAPRARLSWRLLFLSAGELGLADHMAEGMKRVRTGQEVRMADIPADAGAGLGAFENLHDYANGAAFSSSLVREAQACYGAPGRAFITWACEGSDTLAKRVRTAVAALVAQWMPEGASGQVERVGARFALVGVAGAMATAAGLTGWPEGESERAARKCFDAWMAARGGAGNGETMAMRRVVRRFLEAHGEGRFTWWHRGADDHGAKTLNRAGYRRMLNQHGEPIKTNSQHGAEFGDRMPVSLGDDVSVEYFLLPEVFQAEVCQGYDYRAVLRVLLDHGCLLPDKGRPFDARPRLPGLGLTRCYRISPAIFELDE